MTVGGCLATGRNVYKGPEHEGHRHKMLIKDIIIKLLRSYLCVFIYVQYVDGVSGLTDLNNYIHTELGRRAMRTFMIICHPSGPTCVFYTFNNIYIILLCACAVVSLSLWGHFAPESDKNSWDAAADTTDPFSVGRGEKKIKTNRINYYTVVRKRTRV